MDLARRTQALIGTTFALDVQHENDPSKTQNADAIGLPGQLLPVWLANERPGPGHRFGKILATDQIWMAGHSDLDHSLVCRAKDD